MFDQLPLLPADPILGLSQAYALDSNPNKVDLGVGVYKNDAGQTPIMKAVALAQEVRFQTETTKSYTPPAGIAGANEAVKKLVFGEHHSALQDNRVRVVQTPGGCGSLRVAAELIQRAKPGATIWVSTPTWANHIPLLSSAGIQIREYPYYDYNTHSIDFAAMLAVLNTVPQGDLVLLHACCHNPSGADLTQEQWQQVADVLLARGVIAFIDMAYQGFGDGLNEDAYGVRLMAEKLPEVVVATSFSKNFGLYRERAGSLALVCRNPQEADATFSQMLSVARSIYSMPPAHGAYLVDVILHDETLTHAWETELDEMRERIASLRVGLVEALNKLQDQRDFSFIAKEKGMFSFLGLSKEQVAKLKSEYSIYMTDNSRISVAGLSLDKLDYVAKAIVAVL